MKDIYRIQDDQKKDVSSLQARLKSAEENMRTLLSANAALKDDLQTKEEEIARLAARVEAIERRDRAKTALR